MSGSADVVEMLIGSGASVHCRDGDGIMPLDHAASAGDQRIMLKLLAAGAELTPVARSRIHALIWSYVQKGIHLDDVWKSIKGQRFSIYKSEENAEVFCTAVYETDVFKETKE